jgi:hypothetical protein
MIDLSRDSGRIAILRDDLAKAREGRTNVTAGRSLLVLLEALNEAQTGLDAIIGDPNSLSAWREAEEALENATDLINIIDGEPTT